MTAAVSIRSTSPADLDAVVSLLSERDDHRLDRDAVSTALYGLDPAHLVGWIASVGDEPAGLTTLFLREQRWGGEGGRTLRAGYWAHLFVREQFRRLMIYPQLVLAMMRGLKPLGIDAIFTGTRRPHVAEGHVKLGFAKVGEMGVLFKPLRPFRLVARYKKLPGALCAAAAPADAAYSAYLSLRRPRPAPELTIRQADPENGPLECLAGLLNAAGTGRISQLWTADALRRRLAGAIDGRPYRLLLAERAKRIVGAAAYGLAERQGVATGFILDLVTTSSDADAAPALLGRAESDLRGAGADMTLYLDGLGPESRYILRAAGHRIAARETYQMLVYPKTLVPAGSPVADLANWRFSFLDHDAF